MFVVLDAIQQQSGDISATAIVISSLCVFITLDEALVLERFDVLLLSHRVIVAKLLFH